MNKILKFGSLLLTIVLVSSCEDITSISDTTTDVTSTSETTSTSTSSSSASSTVPVNISDDLFISELFSGSTGLDYALEIANCSGTALNLGEYEINIYHKYGVIEYTINFEDNFLLENDSVYVISNNSFDENLLDKVNLQLDSNPILGDSRFEIIKGGVLIDCFGQERYYVDYADKSSCLKFAEYYQAYDQFSPMRYFSLREGISDYLGNLDVPVTFADYIEGPRLSSDYANYDFYQGAQGLGGFYEVLISSLGDGDTTKFTYPDSALNNGMGTRYLGINTPEIPHAEGEKGDPWGIPAKVFNNNILSSAKHIIVQSDGNQPLLETYGRFLGWIWYTNVEEPELTDYRLLNYVIVLNGYSRFDQGKYATMYGVGDVSYYSYMSYAHNYAMSLGIKVFGEVDPDYDY